MFQLKQYKQRMNTPEETELSSITLNGLKDVTVTERLKRSYEIMAQTFASLPSFKTE